MGRKNFAALAAMAGLALGAQSAGAETVLRVTLQLPMTHHLGQNLVEFQKEVEEKTGGEIRFEIYPSAQLYKDNEVPQAVASGAIDMGVASLTLFAGTIPAVDIFYVPFMFTSEEMVREATAPDSPIRQKLDEAILETGARVLWWQAFGGAIFLSKDEPVRTPEDIAGKKVRVFGKTLGDFVETVGGVPTLISGSEQFLAYQRGVVDVGMTGLTTIPSRKLDQVMDAVTVANIADIEFLMLINEDVWQGLTPEQQEIMTTAAHRVERELREQIAELEAEGAEYAEQQGMAVYHPTDEELEAWRAASEPVIEQYVEAAGPLGAELVSHAQELHE